VGFGIKVIVKSIVSPVAKFVFASPLPFGLEVALVRILILVCPADASDGTIIDTVPEDAFVYG
jgi:hypothetical protein